jgi:hypothetical protein
MSVAAARWHQHAMAEQPDDSARIDAWLRAFDEQPDPLHVDITPSVLALIELGLPGIDAVLDRLNAPARLTRKRAQRVLDGALARHLGWVSSVGYPTPEAAQRARAIADANAYDADAAEPVRLAAIARWRGWLAAERARQKEQK